MGRQSDDDGQNKLIPINDYIKKTYRVSVYYQSYEFNTAWRDQNRLFIEKNTILLLNQFSEYPALLTY